MLLISMIYLIWLIWLILISIIESSRIPIIKMVSNEKIHNLLLNNNNSNRIVKRDIYGKVKKPPPTTPKQKAKTKVKAESSTPFSLQINFDFSFSLPSMLSGILLTGATYFYLENQDLKTKNLWNRLLLGEEEVFNEIKRGSLKIPSNLLNDPDFFKEALNRGNQDLCVHLLQSGQSIKILNNEINEENENLLVKVIEKGMSGILDHLLKNRLDEIRVAVDVMDHVNGKTPLLTAVQVKDFKSARALLRLGAKPLIPATSRFQARGIKNFVPKIEDVESEEFARELQAKYSASQRR